MGFKKIFFALSIASLLISSSSVYAQSSASTSAKIDDPSVVWKTGLAVKICQFSDSNSICEDGVMPELLGPVTKVLPGHYSSSARANWLVFADKGVGLCYFGKNIAIVRCVRVNASKDYENFDIGALSDSLIFKRRSETSENYENEDKYFTADFMLALHAAATVLQRDITKYDIRSTGRVTRTPLNNENCPYESWIRWMCDDNEFDLPKLEQPYIDPAEPGLEYPLQPNPLPTVNVHGDFEMPVDCVYGPIVACRFNPPPVTADPTMPPLTSTAPPPLPPPDDEECTKMRTKVWEAKEAVAAIQPSRCEPGMSNWQLFQRKKAWTELGLARGYRDKKCYEGGDKDHQKAQVEAWMHVNKCIELVKPFN
jgi:hypothetical protein